MMACLAGIFMIESFTWLKVSEKELQSLHSLYNG